MAPSQTTFAPAVTVTRRAPIELTLPLAAAAGNGTASDDHSLSLDSPYDVPAFLRRQS